MDVFISWSGERSLKVATALKEWLPLVIQSVTPWFSQEDIDKGARWMAELSKQLDKLKMGIICVTPENMQAPWLLFEAGALSKVLDTSLVCPFLYGLEPTDLKGPIAQFQATRSTKEDVFKLLSTINKNTESPLSDQQLDRLFSVLWHDFEQKLSSIEASISDQVSHPRPVPELLSEVLERVRSIERQLAENITGDEARFRNNKLNQWMNERDKNLKQKNNYVSMLEAKLASIRSQQEELENLKRNASESDNLNMTETLKALKLRERDLCDKIARQKLELDRDVSEFLTYAS